jgi:Ca-activated chloride channel family protein
MYRLEHQNFLYVLEALPFLVLLLTFHRRWRKEAVARLGQTELVERLMEGYSGRRVWLKNLLVGLSLLLLGFAWANPQRGVKTRHVDHRSADVFLALDISNSMLAEDVKPSRLELAKVFAIKLVQALEGERIGLIFFAGNAYLQMPLSTDYGFAITTIRDASPDYITTQGTAIPIAVDLARRSFDKDAGAGQAMVIITDGENHDADAVSAAAAARGDGIQLYAIGAGTAAGAPVPMGDGQFKRDERGRPVRTKLNEALLQDLARAGGGAVYNIQQGEAAVKALKTGLTQLQKRDLEVRSYTEFRSYFQYLLLPGLLLLALDSWVVWRKKSRAVSSEF